MKHQIHISTTAATFESQEDQTVLDAALTAGINYPHSCKSGRCGACKSRLVEGSIEHLPSSRFMLNEEEKNAGVFLACKAKATSNSTVTWLSEDIETSSSEYQGEVVGKEFLTKDVIHLKIRVLNGKEFHFRAGQFANLRFSGCEGRSYSLLNSSTQKRIAEFLIRQVPGGRSTSYLFNELAIGEKVVIQGPFGNSFLRKTHTGPILLVAASTGLAPIYSILKEALENSMKQKIHLYFGVRNVEDLFWVEELKWLEASFPQLSIHIAVEKDNSSGTRTGRIGELIEEDWFRFSEEWHAYIAGSPQMVESVTLKLRERGIGQDSIFADAFYSQADISQGNIKSS